MSARSWCYTLNNPTFAETSAMEELNCRYQVIGHERGESGTYHLQGYIEFGKVMRLSACKKINERAHWEPRRGTREQARDYCMKEDWEEFGDWESGGQGKRNDLEALMARIREGANDREVMEEQPETVARNLRFMEKYRGVVERDETKIFREVNVEVHHGDAGTGKTRYVHEKCPDVFTVNCDEAFPFNGYDGEDAILLDDFYGDIKYHALLRVLDGHQYRVNTKGGHRYARWTKVFITSNKSPAEWYRAGLTPALARRLNVVTEYRNEEVGNTEPPLDIGEL